MEPIQSFVFLDLEATSCEASARPKITELSLAALHRSALLNPDRRLPRVMDKLLLAVYPNKPIPGPVCELTGLTNENLAESERPALDASFVAAVCAFLHRQPPPVALVAHNGLRFDFPLLKTELLKLNARLPEGLRFCDSLLAFRETEDGNGYSLQADVERQNRHVSPAPGEGTALAHESCLGQHDDFTTGTSASKLRNGTTVPSGWDRGTDRAGRVGDVPSGWDRGTDRAGRAGDVPSKRASLSLESLYLRYVSRAPRHAHTAEDDVLALLQVVRVRADTLVPWMDRNGLAWDDIQQMYAPSPVKPAGRISNGDRTGSPARLCLTYED